MSSLADDIECPWCKKGGEVYKCWHFEHEEGHAERVKYVHLCEERGTCPECGGVPSVALTLEAEYGAPQVTYDVIWGPGCRQGCRCGGVEPEGDVVKEGDVQGELTDAECDEWGIHPHPSDDPADYLTGAKLAKWKAAHEAWLNSTD